MLTIKSFCWKASQIAPGENNGLKLYSQVNGEWDDMHIAQIPVWRYKAALKGDCFVTSVKFPQNIVINNN